MKKTNKKITRQRLTLVVVRYNRLGDLRNSKPCHHCIELMKICGVRWVVYSDDYGNLVKEKVLEAENRESCGMKFSNTSTFWKLKLK